MILAHAKQSLKSKRSIRARLDWQPVLERQSANHLLTSRQPHANALAGCPSTAASSPMCHVISIRANAKWAVSVLPAGHCAAPKCHTPSACWPLVLRQSARACNSWLRHQSLAARSRGIRRHCPALEIACRTLECIEAVTTNVVRHRPKPWHHRAMPRI